MNMERKLDLNEVKAIEVEILDYVSNVCESNGLRYFLGGGTLIGAIRHHGFIPWDDDIDIMMPRPDYMKFIEYMRLEDASRFKVLSMYNCEDYYYTFAKVIDSSSKLIENDVDHKIDQMGIYIDVFPIDGLPNTKDEIDIYYGRILRIRKKLYTSLMKKCPKTEHDFLKPLKFLEWKFYEIVGWKKWIIKVDTFSQKYEFEDSKYVGSQAGGLGRKEVFNKELFSNYEMCRFEDRIFRIPTQYDYYLKILYGDYMKLPPEEQRVEKHNFTAFRKSN